MGSCYSKKKSLPRKLHNRYHASKRKLPKKLSGPFTADPNIVILGAGAAGLACAMELRKQGFQQVRILEAASRIGGRIRTMKFADNYVDLGAQWVYGQQDNLVYQMVNKRNMLEPEGDLFQMDWIRSNGQQVPGPLAKRLVNIMSGIIRNKETDIVEHEGIYGEYLVQKFAEELSKPTYRHISNELAAEFLRTFKKMEGSAVDTDMSAAGYETYSPCPGTSHLNWRDQGFREFLRILLKGDEMNLLGELKDSIDLNTRVQQIEWDQRDGTVLITCENNTKYLADHVIITVSLGVLKANTTFFHPNLPQTKRKAINFMGFGHICKIFVEFEEKFWHDNWRGFNAMWRAEEMHQPQLEWLPDIFCFHVYAHQPRVLLAWATGSYTEVIEKTDDKLLAQGVVYMLRRFLPKTKIPQPKRVVCSKWCTDPGHLGGYSYPTVLTQDYNTGPEQLAQPVNVLVYEPKTKERVSLNHVTPISVRPILLFAGEATSSHHYSTVHGAVETGIREARRLTGYYQKELI